MRSAGAVALATVAVLLVPATAQASETKRVNTRYDIETVGYALTAATVRFPSRKAFDVQGWVKDVCGGDPSGDGRGAYVSMVFTPRGGEQHRTRIGKDVNGCSNGKRHYNPAPKKFDRRISSVTIVVCEADADDPDESSPCAFKQFDNWRLD